MTNWLNLRSASVLSFHISRLRRWIFFGLVCAPIAFRSAYADPLIVTSAADSEPGSLRAAVAASGPGYIISFSAALNGQAISLTSGQIKITNNLVIDASGVSIFLAGTSTSRVFQITSNASVQLINLQFVSGHVSGDSGGAIRNDGTLTAVNCSFLGNAAQGGNGVTPVSGSDAGPGGGGAGMGGAIFSDGAGVALIGCTFIGNQALGGNGGIGDSNGATLVQGGNGGGPNGGLGGGDNSAGSAGGFGGGGGGGGTESSGFGTTDGGPGGFGGGGGGGSANGGGGSGGVGGAAGFYAGKGGSGFFSYPGGGGGGAGLGGAVFASTGTITIQGCSFVNNLATNGVGGLGSFGLGNGSDGLGLGGAIFISGGGLTMGGNSFNANVSSSSSSQVALTVENTADTGPGNLRNVVTNAPSGATILFSTNVANKALMVTSAPVVISTSLTMDGSFFTNGIAISGAGAARVLQVNSNIAVVLNSLTISNGLASANSGGAIHNDGSLTALNCVFNGNVAQGGNGVTPGSGNNGGPGGGGAGLGGAIFSDGPMLTLGNCTFTGNLARGGNGGTGNNNSLTNGPGGNGGGPNGGAGGTTGNVGGNGGLGGGGGGGGGNFSAAGFNGGAGGFGGGGGGGGAKGSGGSGGLGGAAGTFAGGGGAAFSSVSGGGGGGAGLGGALFVVTGQATITNCSFTANQATNGLGGAGSFGAGNGTNGQAWAGGIFNLGGTLTLFGLNFSNNIALTGAPDVYDSVNLPTASTVTTPFDSGSGSLRAILTNVPAGATITFAQFLAGEAVAVTNGQMTLSNNVTIDASGLIGGVTILGDQGSRIFQVTPNTSVTLKSLTIAGGGITNDTGGAVRNDGSLTALNCVFSNNVANGGNGGTTGVQVSGGPGGGGAGMGGAIFSDGPALTLNGCAFNSNLAQGGNGGAGNSWGSLPTNGLPGGGINGALGGVPVTDPTYLYVGYPPNVGGFGGGGGGGTGAGNFTMFPADSGAPPPMNGGTGGFGGGGGGGANHNANGIGGAGGKPGVFGGAGGAGFNFLSGGAGGGAGLGGAIFAKTGQIIITNCSFSGNIATNGLGGAGSANGTNGQAWGGALFNMCGNFSLTNSAFTNNSAATGSPDLFTLPQLNVTSLNGNLQFSWATNQPGFSVQYTTNLAPPIAWLPLNSAVTTNGTFFQQTTVAPGSAVYFELFHSSP